MRALLALGCVAFAFAACSESDVGRCCEVLIQNGEDLLPVSEEISPGKFINDVSRDPAFDCESLTCVAFLGSEAYCTAACSSDEDCPGGFVCVSVLQSDPPPGSSITAEDMFCVRDEFRASCD